MMISIIIFYSMKSFTYRNGEKPMLKFDKFVKEQMRVKRSKGSKEKIKLTDRDVTYDCIKQLKEQNGELSQIVKIQQTKINYFKSKEKRKLQCDSLDNSSMAQVRTINLGMKDQIERLQKQINCLKKTIKYTNIKELQNTNFCYLGYIKTLLGKIKAMSKEKNVNELNKIIQNEYHLSLLTKQLEEELGSKKRQINQNVKMIRKLTNIITNRDKQIKQLKQAIEEMDKNDNKKKKLDDYVHKSQLIEKQKIIMNLSEGIQMLEKKLWECENKINTLETENIENINKEAKKRREILQNYENLKKENANLEDALLKNIKKSIRKNMEVSFDNSQQNIKEVKKQKNPLVIKVDHVKDIIDEIIYVFQKNRISVEMALQLICGNKNELTIRDFMNFLNGQPLKVEDENQRELFARYVIEDSCENNFVNFDEGQCIKIVKSILKQIFNNYPLYKHEEQNKYKNEIQQFYRTNSIELRIALMEETRVLARKSMMITTKSSGKTILNVFEKQNILQKEVVNYMQFKIYEKLNQQMSLDQFLSDIGINPQSYNPTYQSQL